MSRKKTENHIISVDASIEDIDPRYIDDFKKLNDKCDHVITKIKIRKSKSGKNNGR